MIKKKKNIIVTDEKSNDRVWADIPSDILCEIYSRLVAGERAMFRSTCRSWNSVYTIAQQFELSPDLLNKSKLVLAVPCLLYFDNRVFYPILDKHCYMDFQRVPKSVVVVAKDGWFLMKQDWEDLFLYNPITKLEVNLPHIDIDNHRCISIKSAYFSSPPNSTDWLAIVAGCSYNIRDRGRLGLFINTIKSGDHDWRVCKVRLSEKDSFLLAFCSPVVFEGMFYFLGKGARLLIHDPKSQKNYLHDAPESLSGMKTWHWSSGDHYLLESDGEILAVLVGCEGMQVLIFRWNLSKKIWEAVTSLEGKMLFVSRPFSVSVKSSIVGTGNKIYFPKLAGSHGLFYSLSTKRFYTFAATGGTCYESFVGSIIPEQAFWWWKT